MINSQFVDENNKKFLNIYILYIILLFFFSVVNLYFKKDVGLDSTINEWIINYQGGFTRRGLIGEIFYHLAITFKFSLRDVIFLFQVFICFFYFILILYFIKDVKFNLFLKLSLFSPIFLLYPVAEIEVLARKETIIFISLQKETVVR